MPKIDEEMRRWCETLADEVSGWPQVTGRPMFGLTGFYRGKRIFAAVPRTRAVGNAFSLLLKLPDVPPRGKAAPIKERARLKSASGPGAGWVTFELHSPEDIPEALRWLERAYEKASPRTKRR